MRRYAGIGSFISTLLGCAALMLMVASSASAYYKVAWVKGGPGPGSGQGEFSSPSGIATDASGNVYVADRGNGRLVKLDSSGTWLFSFAGCGCGVLQDVTPDAAGNIWFTQGLTVDKYGSTGTPISYFDQNSGPWHDPHPFMPCCGFDPHQIAVDGDGNIVLTEPSFQSVDKFAPDGTLLASFLYRPSTGVEGTPVPWGVAASQGDVFYVDTGNREVFRIKGDLSNGLPGNQGVLSRRGGLDDPTFPFPYDPHATFDGPRGVAVGGFDNHVFVADTKNSRIRGFDFFLNGNYTTFGQQGSGSGQFDHPYDVAVDPAGNVYVADTGNNRVEKFAATTPGVEITNGAADGASVGQYSAWWNFSATRPGAIAETGAHATISYECSFDQGTPSWFGCGEGTSGSFQAGGYPDGDYTFRVVAEDVDGTSAPVTRSVHYDGTAPVVAITGPDFKTSDSPPIYTHDSTPTFFFSTSPDAHVYKCELYKKDANGQSNLVAQYGDGNFCNSPIDTGSLTDGYYSFVVYATDGVHNTSQNRNFTLDTDAPESQIDGSPFRPTNDTSPSFAFSSDEAGVTFECSLTQSHFPDFHPCTSPAELGPVSGDGDYIFSVRATDKAGNTEVPWPKSDITIDTLSPQVTIDTGPADGSTTGNDPSFTYSSPDADLDHFECRLDNALYAETCPNTGRQYSDLADGEHSFGVVAVDTAGNVSSEPTRNFTVDGTAPDTQIDSGPTEGSTVSDHDFLFDYSGIPTTDADHFACTLDEVAVTCPVSSTDPGTGSTLLLGLPEGFHTFTVAAVDAAGNADQSPATRSWRIYSTRCDIFGTSASEKIVGTPGDDVICGGDGNDRIKGGGGDDIIRGEGGNDRIAGAGGSDQIDGGAGDDTARYRDGASEGVEVNLASGEVADDGFGNAETVTGVENVKGAKAYPNTLTGDDAANHLRGGSAADTLTGGSGSDFLNGGKGDDTLFGEDGADTLDPGRGTNGINGDDGSDTLSFSTIKGPDGLSVIDSGGDGGAFGAGFTSFGSIENVTGSPNADSITVNFPGTASVVRGGDGDDGLSTADGDALDTMDGGAGADGCDNSDLETVISC